MPEEQLKSEVSENENGRIRHFSQSTPDQFMLRVYESLVPGNRLNDESFREIPDELRESRNEMYWQSVEHADQASLEKGGGRIYVGDDPYMNSYKESHLIFYDEEGRVVSLTRDEKLNVLSLAEMPDVSNPDLHLGDSFAGRKSVRILDAGIGLSRIIEKVRSEIEALGIKTEASGINIIPLPDGAHPGLNDLFIGRFEQNDFNGKQFDLIYSSMACGAYTPDEDRFVRQLEKIVAEKGMVVMDIGGHSEGRWRKALDMSGRFDYEFLRSIQHTEEIKDGKLKIPKVEEQFQSVDSAFKKLCDDLRHNSFFDTEIIEGIISELAGAKKESDIQIGKCPNFERVFNSADISQQDKDMLRNLCDIAYERVQALEHVNIVHNNIAIYSRYLIHGILIRRK